MDILEGRGTWLQQSDVVIPVPFHLCKGHSHRLVMQGGYGVLAPAAGLLMDEIERGKRSRKSNPAMLRTAILDKMHICLVGDSCWKKTQQEIMVFLTFLVGEN
jgi:hypothetical protein